MDLPQREKQMKEGGEEIAEAQRLHPQTAKEQGFLTAAAAFYQDDSKLTHIERMKAYSAAMEKLHEQARILKPVRRWTYTAGRKPPT